MMQLLIPSIPVYQPYTRPFGIKGKFPNERLLFSWLEDDAQEKVLDKIREWQTRDNWFDGVYQNAHDLLVMLGFADIDISFSGFWNHGDGASFIGVWCDDFVKLDKARDEFRCDQTTSLIDEITTILVERQFTGNELPQITLTRHGNYVHEQSIDYEFNYSDEWHADDAQDNQAEGRLRAWCVDLMCWIYRSLEAEYNYLSSDEQILEQIRDNDYRFSPEGDILCHPF